MENNQPIYIAMVILESERNELLLIVERLEVQRAGVEKWNGTLPQYQGMGAVPFIELPTAK